jgi:hypothetical protein
MEHIAIIKKLTAQLEMCRLDAKMALSNDWDRGDEGFQAQIDAIDALIGKEDDEEGEAAEQARLLLLCKEDDDEEEEKNYARLLLAEQEDENYNDDVMEEEDRCDNAPVCGCCWDSAIDEAHAREFPDHVRCLDCKCCIGCECCECEELEDGYFNDGKEKYHVIKGVKIYACNCENNKDIRGRCDPKSKEWDYCLYQVSNTYWWLHNTYGDYEKFCIGGSGGATNREERNKIAFRIAQERYGLQDGDWDQFQSEFEEDDKEEDE